MKGLVLGAAFGCVLSVANARDFGQWEGTEPHIRQWYQALMQPDILIFKGPIARARSPSPKR